MTRTRIIILLLVIAFVIALVAAFAPLAGADQHTRFDRSLPDLRVGNDVQTLHVSGATRVHTAVALSRVDFPHGVHTVYLVSADHLPDGLASGTHGSVLYIFPCQPFPAVVQQEIDRLQPDRVIAVGGGTETDCTPAGSPHPVRPQ